MRALLLLIFVVEGLWGQPGSHRPVAIEHVMVIDMTGSSPKADMTVVIEGDRIAAIGPSSQIKVPDAAQKVNGAGKSLIPGLWDMHVHTLRPERRETLLPLLVANGVTGVRDMGSPLPWEEIHRWQAEIAEGKLLGPRIAACGRILDGPRPFYPGLSQVAKTPGDGRRAVVSLRNAGADFIKVYSRLPREVYFAIADEAKKRGIPFAGHVPESVTAGEASDAGQQSMEHLLGILAGCSSRETELVSQAVLAAATNDPAPFVAHARTAAAARDLYSDAKARDLFERLARNRTWQVPTLVLGRIWELLYDGSFPDRGWLHFVPHAMREGWQEQPAFGKPAPADVARGKNVFRYNLELVGEMYRAGAPILAGTDSSFPYMVAGFSLHDELGLLVRAGLSPMAALRSATRNPAEYLGVLDLFGTIEKGKIADLVLLEASPLIDIRNTRKIAAVVLRGKLIEKPALQKILADVEAAAKDK